MMFPFGMVLKVLTAQRALVDRLLFAVRFPTTRTVQINTYISDLLVAHRVTLLV